MSRKINCDCVSCLDLKAVKENAKVLAPEHRYARLHMYSHKEVWHCSTCCEDHILHVYFGQRIEPDTKALWLVNECKLKKGEKLLATAEAYHMLATHRARRQNAEMHVEDIRKQLVEREVLATVREPETAVKVQLIGLGWMPPEAAAKLQREHAYLTKRLFALEQFDRHSYNARKTLQDRLSRLEQEYKK